MTDPGNSTPRGPGRREDVLKKGVALHRAGRLSDAEAVYRTVLGEHPDDADALHLLAIIAHQRGAHQAAINLAARAVDLKPTSPVFRNTLGIACLAVSDAERATAAFESAIAIAPRYPEPHVNLGNLRRRQGDRDAALAHYRRAIALDPNSAQAHNNLGTLLTESNRASDAIGHLERALHLRPEDPEVLNNLGVARRACGRRDAIDCFQRALARRPNDAGALANLGSLLLDLGDARAAVDWLQRAVLAAPDEIGHRAVLGDALLADGQVDAARESFAAAAGDQSRVEGPMGLARVATALGRFDDALAWLIRARDIDPRHPDVLAAIVEHKRARATPEEVAEAQALAERTELPERQRARLHFALGQAREGIAAYETAFQHYAAGNRLRSDEIARQGRAYDPDLFDAQVDRTIVRYDAAFFERHAALGNDSELPVLILGMPRAGSTLCEAILASHPEVHGGGELLDVPELAAATEGGNEDDSPLRLSHAQVAEGAERYLAKLRSLSPTARRVSDKHPANFLHIGLIAVLFPRSRIIHCVRDPLDVAVSCFTQNFLSGMPWTYDLDSIAHYYRQYARLMRHWCAVLPIPIHPFRYEAVVDAPEREARGLLEFCGLPWEARCLEFHRTERPILTASLRQVREPINRRSVGRWRRFEPYIQPLIAALGPDV